MKSVVISSYKDRVGKTTIAMNLAILIAQQGSNVYLLEQDFFYPSFTTFFQPQVPWINAYLNGDESFENCIQNTSEQLGLPGNLYISFADPTPEAISTVHRLDKSTAVQWLQNLDQIRKDIIEKKPYRISYFIIDNPASSNYTAVNSMLVTDSILFVMSLTKDDIIGTIKLIAGLYPQLKQQPLTLFNLIPDYITEFSTKRNFLRNMYEEFLRHETKVDVAQFLGWIPFISDFEATGVQQAIETLQGRKVTPVISSIDQPESNFSRILTELVPIVFSPDSRKTLDADTIARMATIYERSEIDNVVGYLKEVKQSILKES